MICPGGKYQCPAGQKCCPKWGQWGCCRYGPGAVCCPHFSTCCPPGSKCDIVRPICLRSSLLVNNTDKLGHDGTAGIHPKVTRIIPSQQLEMSSLKRIGFRRTSGDILFPDEQYQCPDGTSPCELFYGIYGCCPIQNKDKDSGDQGVCKGLARALVFLGLENCIFFLPVNQLFFTYLL